MTKSAQFRQLTEAGCAKEHFVGINNEEDAHFVTVSRLYSFDQTLWSSQSQAE